MLVLRYQICRGNNYHCCVTTLDVYFVTPSNVWRKYQPGLTGMKKKSTCDDKSAAIMLIYREHHILKEMSKVAFVLKGNIRSSSSSICFMNLLCALGELSCSDFPNNPMFLHVSNYKSSCRCSKIQPTMTLYLPVFSIMDDFPENLRTSSLALVFLEIHDNNLRFKYKHRKNCECCPVLQLNVR